MGESGLLAELGYSLTDSSYTALATVKNFKPSGVEKKTIEVKALSQAWIEYLAGFKDGGTVDFDLEHDDTEMGVICNTIFATKVPYWYKFVLDNGADANDIGTSVKFKAQVTKYTPLSTDDEGKVTNSVSLKITGAVTFAGKEVVAGP